MFRLLALCGPDEPDAQKLFAPGRFSCFGLAPGRIMFSLITLNYITTAAQVASHGKNALPCARRCGKCRLLLRHKPGTPAKQARIIAPSLLKTAQSGDILYRKGVNAPILQYCTPTRTVMTAALRENSMKIRNLWPVALLMALTLPDRETASLQITPDVAFSGWNTGNFLHAGGTGVQNQTTGRL